MDTATYNSKHGKDSHGITISDDLEVHFQKKRFTLELVRHELFHAYMASCCANSTDDITAADTEEMAAEVYEYHGPTMDVKSKEIYERLKWDFPIYVDPYNIYISYNIFNMDII